MGLTDLPFDVLLLICARVDVQSLGRLACSCHTMAACVRSPFLFADLLRRHFADFVHSERPYLELPILESFRNEPLHIDAHKTLENAAALLADPRLLFVHLWRQRARLQMSDCAFVGGYGPHGLEFVRVERSGFRWRGIKMTGDPNVPSGKVTFDVLMDPSLMYGTGRITLAQTGYCEVHYEACQLSVYQNLLLLLWIHPTTDNVRPETISNRTIKDIPHVVFLTAFEKATWPLSVVSHAITTLPKDELGNVDRRVLMDLLEENHNQDDV